MADGQRVSALSQIYVPTTAGGSVPLTEIAQPALKSAIPVINRLKLQRTVTVRAYNRDGYLASSLTQKVEDSLTKIPLPSGYRFGLGGEAEQATRSFSGLGPIILLTVFGIFGVLVLEFGRFRETIVVAGVIPLGTFGGLIALLMTGYSMSFLAIIGFVALIGIEIKNSILLVDFTTQLRDRGLPLREAIEKAGEIRFLPVLLTSVTAIGGLLPLALGGSALYSPLAWVIIGGLVEKDCRNLNRSRRCCYFCVVRVCDAIPPSRPHCNIRISAPMQSRPQFTISIMVAGCRAHEPRTAGLLILTPSPGS
jgi:multidrug efflux pump subunit AcrB